MHRVRAGRRPAAAPYPAPGEKGHATRAVVGSAGAIQANGAAKLGDAQHGGGYQVGPSPLGAGKAIGELGQQAGECSFFGALARMGVPAGLSTTITRGPSGAAIRVPAALSRRWTAPLRGAPLAGASGRHDLSAGLELVQGFGEDRVSVV